MSNLLFDAPSKINTGAVFSECRRYRYMLWRIWDESKPLIQFIGLNPSTANETANDNTMRRVIRYAKDWGYGGVYMMNLFAIVSTDPKILKTCEDPLGENDKYLKEINGKCQDVLFAWGNFDVFGRDKAVEKMFSNAVVLGYNKNNSPKHPLMCRADLKPQPYIYNRQDG